MQALHRAGSHVLHGPLEPRTQRVWALHTAGAVTTDTFGHRGTRTHSRTVYNTSRWSCVRAPAGGGHTCD